MKIAVVSDVIYPWVIGGEKRYYEIFSRLAKKHEVHFYTMFYRKMHSREFEYEGMKVHCVCDAPKSLYSGRRRKIIPAIKFSLLLYGKLKQEKFDLIECNEFPFLPCFTAKRVARMQNIPLFVTWHEVWGDYWYDYMGRIGVFGKFTEKLTTKISDKVISVSGLTKRKLTAMGVHARCISVIPNGVNLEAVRKAKPKRIKNDVLFVGRLIKDKNVDILLEALALLDVTCIIIGDGPEKKRLESLAKKLNLEKRIRFIDFLPKDEEIYSYMKSSKLLAIPSTREGFGLVAVEANACGIPVLTVDSPDNAVRDFVKDGVNGKVVKLNDRSIADGIKQLFGMKVKIKLDGYRWSDIAKQLEEVYRA